MGDQPGDAPANVSTEGRQTRQSKALLNKAEIALPSDRKARKDSKSGGLDGGAFIGQSDT